MTDSHPGPTAMVDASTGSTEWSIRLFRDDDVPAVVALINAIDSKFDLGGGTSEDEFRRELAAPRRDPARQSIVVDGPAVPGVVPGTAIGYGRAVYEDDETTSERLYFLHVSVHPAAERRGLERVIFGHLLDIIRGYEADPSMKQAEKVWVKGWAYEHRPPLRELYSGLGMREARMFWTMARDLTEPIDEPRAVEGVNIRNYRHPEDDVAALDAFNDSFSDHWDHHPVPLDDWQFWISGKTVRHDLSWLAEDELNPGKIVGFCICVISEDDNKRNNKCEGWIELLGTTRSHRNKGLGRALLLHGLHSLRSASMDTALLGVDSESPTGANRLYESAGFRTRRRGIAYECLLDELKA